MPQQKISLARIYLLFSIIISVGAVLGFMLAIGKIGRINQPIAANPTGKEVTIATDKLEYEQGEIIKIVVNNGLNKPILYSRAAGQFWRIEYFENDKWINPAYKEGGGFQLTEKNIGDACYIALYERSFPEELTSQSNLTAQWNQKICPFGTEGPDKPKIVKYIESGKYRLIFRYGFEKSSNDSFKISEPKIVYSNEFTIKEKIAIDSRCNQKVRGISPSGRYSCPAMFIGYEFDTNSAKCIEKKAGGCYAEIPFNSLEECQKTCEK